MTRLLSLVVLVFLPSCQVDLSWKPVTFQLDNFDAVYEATRVVIARHYYGVSVYESRENGTIETDYIYKFEAEPMVRQKVHVKIVPLDGSITVEVLAIIEEGIIDVGEPTGVQWRTLGSDVPVENILLDEITREVGALDVVTPARENE